MKAARSRRWQVGDRFSLNRWSAAWPEPLVFTVTQITQTRVYFWNAVWDEAPGARQIDRRAFYRKFEHRELVRIWD